MRYALAATTALLIAATPLTAQNLELLEAEIGRLAEISGGTVGVAAVHLETGRSVFLNRDVRFPMASTYKVPIAVQLLTRVDRGEISLSDMVEIGPEDLHPGSGTLSNLFDDPGVSLSLHNLLELMLLISDNSATDLTLRAAGGPTRVNARMTELGVTGLQVDRPTSLLIADWLGVTGVPENGEIDSEGFAALMRNTTDDSRRRAAERFATDPRDTSTPEAMARLLEVTWRGAALSEENRALFFDIMRRVETGENRIRGMLPPGTVVAHKTGTIGATTNDVGIIYLPGNAGHVITVVFVKDSEREVPDREHAIAEISRAIHDFFLFQRGS